MQRSIERGIERFPAAATAAVCRRRPPSFAPPPPRQAYAANYSGHAKIDRLLFAADKSAGKPLELESLKLAADALKRVRLAPVRVPFEWVAPQRALLGD